jgi:two-component system chemotaxis response regulator CheB
MFQSVAEQVGRFAVAALLTGMGSDGAAGLLSIRQAGGRTFAQDEQTSVVYGMPSVAWEIQAAEEQLPLDAVAKRLLASAA